MRIATINNITRLTAGKGKFLISGDSIGTEVWLSPDDSIENWVEGDYPKEQTAEEELTALKAEKKAFIEAYSPAMSKAALEELIGGYTKKRAEPIEEPIELPQKEVSL